MSKLIVLEDRVAIRQDEAIKKTAGGLSIPEISQRKPLMGTVVTVGPGKPGKQLLGYLHNDVFYQSMDGRPVVVGDRIVPVYEMAIKEGDRVFFSAFAGIEIEHEGKSFLVMRITDLISRV